MTRSFLVPAGLLLLAALAGCSNDKTTTSGMGTVRMFVTDAPAAVNAVNLDVIQVEVHTSSPDTVQGWSTISTDSVRVDLIALQNGVLRALTTATLPAGVYDQVRLKLGAGSTVVVDGVTHPLVVPSGQTSGVKVNGPFTITEGQTLELALDFDAAHSVHETGNGTWMMVPVVRLVQLATQARILGVVAPAGAATSVVAMAGADTVQSTVPVTGTGSFVLAGLPAGTYSVGVAAASGFRDTTITGVTVASGGTRDLGTITLSPATPQ